MELYKPAKSAVSKENPYRQNIKTRPGRERAEKEGS
jgi:hypothetical protein